jgi:hypothetical protein
MPVVVHVPAFPRVVEVDMAERIRCMTLAPGESVVVTFDYTKMLGALRIQSSTWAVTPSGSPVTAVGVAFTPPVTVVSATLAVDPLFAGCAHATVTNTITTVDGQIFKRCMSVDVDECGGCGC